MKYDFTTLINRRHVGSSKYELMIAQNPDLEDSIIPYSVADMEFKTPPEIVEALKQYLDDQILGYTRATPAYLKAVRNWMKTRHDWEIKDEWIVCTPGVVNALYAAVRAYTEVGDGVIIMPPVYHPFYSAIELSKRTLVTNPLTNVMNRYEIDFEDLEIKTSDPRNKVLLFCSPHNPVGRVWTENELIKVAEICLRNNVLIVSDEIHFDLIMPGYSHTVFAKIEGVLDHLIVCTAPSKTFNLAGLQTSNIIIPHKGLRDAFREELAKNAIFDLNALGYKACETAYNECEPWLDELIEVIFENHKILKEHMEKNHPEIVVYSLEGTYLQWMDFRSLGLERKELEKMLQNDAKIYLNLGYMFGVEGEGFVRMNIACPTHILKEGLERLSNAIDHLK
ncbi:MAG: MalY/PatB family protein [Clostridiaceae bacterium]